MKNLKNVPDLRFCRLLSVNEFPETENFWINDGYNPWCAMKHDAKMLAKIGCCDFYPAPDAIEIMEKLDQLGLFCPTLWKVNGKWEAGCHRSTHANPEAEAFFSDKFENPADAALQLYHLVRGVKVK